MKTETAFTMHKLENPLPYFRVPLFNFGVACSDPKPDDSPYKARENDTVTGPSLLKANAKFPLTQNHSLFNKQTTFSVLPRFGPTK
jgi:hypothetical protein